MPPFPFLVAVKFKYDAMRDDEISLMKGAIVTIMEKSADGWWRGECGQNKVGWFPSNYVQELYDMHSNTPQQVPSESIHRPFRFTFFHGF